MLSREIWLVLLVACDAGSGAPQPTPVSPPPVVPTDERCLPVLECGECPGPCSAGSRDASGHYVIAGHNGFGPPTIRRFCVGTTCTDVFDLHRPCKDLCAPPTTIDRTCAFDDHHRCSSGGH